ncbi:hypothetical protein LXL04_022632 [Taraxacum kok-saghyz]
MGGCCSSSRKFQFHGTPVYYYCPPPLEQSESSTPQNSPFSTRPHIDVDLDMSIPDTFRSPPTPIPFDVVLGIPHSTNTTGPHKPIPIPIPIPVNVKELDREAEGDTHIVESMKKDDVGIYISKGLDGSKVEEEDVCPTCFEEYDAENPRIITKCNHQFHLSCILEWMERNDTCPFCNQVMDFEAL